ncbi:uncharacterized protein [Venturia canescens]|uniref:uncharacterized protein isoform X2 n=1 Tax=Venturia canescens TaxID=32260 RepID=UPI001C9C9B38|nr:uncharacterized protein LOC122406962 isoform X2 [Venturia canescens]
MLKPSAPPIATVEDSFYPEPQVVSISTLSLPSRNPVQSPINPNFNINDTYPSASSEPRIIYVANPPTNANNSCCCRCRSSRPVTRSSRLRE